MTEAGDREGFDDLSMSTVENIGVGGIKFSEKCNGGDTRLIYDMEGFYVQYIGCVTASKE